MIATSANRFPDATTPPPLSFDPPEPCDACSPFMASQHAFTVIAGPRGARASFPSLRARATFVLRHCERERSEREAIQNRERPYGTPPARDSQRRPTGLLRRLRRLAMTVHRAVPSPPAHDSRHRRPSVIASPRASAGEAIQNRAGPHASASQ